MEHVLNTLHAAQTAHSVQRIYVSAPPEVRAEFVRLLPRRWRALVDLELHLPVSAGAAEVLAAATAAQERAERRAEVELVQSLSDNPHAVRGAAAVTEAVADGEVALFIYAEATRLWGAVCTTCGWLMPDPMRAQCGRCGADTERDRDLIDVCIDRVLRQGGRIEQVKGEAARDLQETEGVAVLLRFTRNSAASPGGVT